MRTGRHVNPSARRVGIKGSLLIAGTVAIALAAGAVTSLQLHGKLPVGAAVCALDQADLGRFVSIPGGGFVKGAGAVYPEEGSPQNIFVSPFRLQTHEVTNSQFAAFVAATGYVSAAERKSGSAQFVASETPDVPMSWWKLDSGATWKTPGGAGSNLDGLAMHPVVHVTLDDARAYAKWAGGRIPTEVEWEYAASRGLFDPDDPESGVRGPNGEPRANIWTGMFPVINSNHDGYSGTAPVGCFPPGLTGAYDMIGNVWEWTESRFAPAAPRFIIKGGSYLCSENYCRRYRVAARQNLEVDFSTAHIGFRIAKDIK